LEAVAMGRIAADLGCSSFREEPKVRRLFAGGEWIRTSSSAREALSRFDESWPLRRVEQTDPGKKDHLTPARPGAAYTTSLCNRCLPRQRRPRLSPRILGHIVFVTLGLAGGMRCEEHLRRDPEWRTRRQRLFSMPAPAMWSLPSLSTGRRLRYRFGRKARVAGSAPGCWIAGRRARTRKE
jgi:hypothetical protein